MSSVILIVGHRTVSGRMRTLTDHFCACTRSYCPKTAQFQTHSAWYDVHGATVRRQPSPRLTVHGTMYTELLSEDSPVPDSQCMVRCTRSYCPKTAQSRTHSAWYDVHGATVRRQPSPRLTVHGTMYTELLSEDSPVSDSQCMVRCTRSYCPKTAQSQTHSAWYDVHGATVRRQPSPGLTVHGTMYTELLSEDSPVPDSQCMVRCTRSYCPKTAQSQTHSAWYDVHGATVRRQPSPRLTVHGTMYTELLSEDSPVPDSQCMVRCTRSYCPKTAQSQTHSAWYDVHRVTVRR